MKKIIMTLVLFMVFCTQAFGAWTLSVDYAKKVTPANNYIVVKVIGTSDGSALSATDIMALIGSTSSITDGSMIFLYVDPGTGGVAPNNTINITLTNNFDQELWAQTGISYTAGSWHKLWEDIGSFPPLLDQLKLAINDIGDSGDQVTLYFYIWREKQ